MNHFKFSLSIDETTVVTNYKCVLRLGARFRILATAVHLIITDTEKHKHIETESKIYSKTDRQKHTETKTQRDRKLRKTETQRDRNIKS